MTNGSHPPKSSTKTNGSQQPTNPPAEGRSEQ